jgi:DNA-binding NarL/FixJ family response regulator
MNTQILPEEVSLTSRQREVLLFIGRGYTNEEIAKLLNITRHTVKAHLCAVYEVLGTASRVHAVIKAIQLGILNIEDL